jgi:anaerobic magnesium-protoporphyrin IX monomethyl ester cyclase
MFMDNCLTANTKNLKAICEMIIAEAMEIEWDCASYENLNNLTDDMLSLMYTAGCRMIHMGIESGSDHTRKAMNKSTKLNDIERKIKLIKKNKINVGAWFMIGFIGENIREMQKTMKYAFALDPALLTFTIVYPLPGTDIYNYMKQKYKFQRMDWTNFDIYNSEYPLSDLSSKKLIWFLKMIRFRIRMTEKFKHITSLLVRK